MEVPRRETVDLGSWLGWSIEALEGLRKELFWGAYWGIEGVLLGRFSLGLYAKFSCFSVACAASTICTGKRELGEWLRGVVVRYRTWRKGDSQTSESLLVRNRRVVQMDFRVVVGYGGVAYVVRGS